MEKERRTEKLTCIGCPMGCMLTVDRKEEGEIAVEGNFCKRGTAYAKKELTNPTRIVTSSVRVCNGTLLRVSVKTSQDIPKNRIMDIMQEIKRAKVDAPVKIGDIIIENCAGTGAHIVATKDVERHVSS